MGYSEEFIPDGMNAFERNVKRIGDCIVAAVPSDRPRPPDATLAATKTNRIERPV